MSSPKWQEMHQALTAAGLIVQKSAENRIENLQSIIPLIEAANSSGVRLLNANSVEELLAITTQESEVQSDSVKPQSQTTLPKSENEGPIGRVIAPLERPHLTPPRPRNSSGFSSEDFPLEASEVDSDIEIHFDITGKSSTEGRISDMQSCFRSRLSQIRDMMLSQGVLPRRPLTNSDAWRNRRRYNSKDYEITIVGLASDVKSVSYTHLTLPTKA